jgi:hypothetical protein
VVELGLDRLRLGTDPVDLAQDLVQLDQVLDVPVAVVARRPVGQVLDPAQHAHGQRLAALGAAATGLPGALGLPVDPAGPVAVGVVLALFREELQGAGQAAAVPHREVVRLAGEQGGLAGQRGRRVRVRVRDQAVTVQAGHPPVHRRVGGEPGLHRGDVLGQVGIAVGDRVEARLRAQRREPRRPDVRGDQVAARLQGDLQQVPGVEAQDRPAVRGEVADPAQRRVEAGGGREVRHVDEVVHLAGPVVALVDRGDLHAEHEPGRTACLQRTGQPLDHLGLVGQPEEPGRVVDQIFAQMIEPGRVGEVAGAQQRDSLAPRPPGQVG